MKVSAALISAISLSIFANGQIFTSPDECSRMNGLVLVPYSIALACLDSFPPLAPSIRNQIIATAQTLFQLYPYYDIQKESPEPKFPARIDIGASLEAIAKTNYKSDRAFHVALGSLVRELRDAHAAYSHCYQGFMWVQPWSIVAEYPNAATGSTDLSKKPVLKLNSLITQNWISNNRPLDVQAYITAFRSNLGYDPALFLGARVVQIDGVEAVDFVLNASKTGTTVTNVKDDNARFNSMLSNSVFYYGEFILGDGELARTNKVPDSSTRRYTLALRNGTTISLNVPWYMLNPVSPRAVVGLSGRQEFYEALCMRPELPFGALEITNSSIDIRTIFFNGRKLNRRQHNEELTQFEPLYHDGFNPPPVGKLIPQDINMEKAIPKNISTKDFSKFNFAVANGSPILRNNYTAFYVLPDKKTGVWVLPTVNPGGIRLSDGRKLSATQTELAEWGEALLRGLLVFQRMGIKKLIIDVSQNGGGIVCYSQLITRLLFSDVKFPIQDMRVSDLLTSIAKASVTSDSSGYYDSETKPAVDGQPRANLGDWIIPRSPGPIDTPGIYTQQYNDSNCNNFMAINIPRIRSNGFKLDFWDPKNVAILSDGSCGSACSFITRAWVEQKKLKVYVYGGPVDTAKGNPFPWCGFDGGPVASEAEIRREVLGVQRGLAVPDAASAPGTAPSWPNLIALNSPITVPVSINFSIPVAGTYGATSLNRHTEWFYEAAFDSVNTANGFENRPSLWAEVAKRMETEVNNVGEGSGEGGGSEASGVSDPFESRASKAVFLWLITALTFWCS